MKKPLINRKNLHRASVPGVTLLKDVTFFDLQEGDFCVTRERYDNMYIVANKGSLDYIDPGTEHNIFMLQLDDSGRSQYVGFDHFDEDLNCTIDSEYSIISVYRSNKKLSSKDFDTEKKLGSLFKEMLQKIQKLYPEESKNIHL